MNDSSRDLGEESPFVELDRDLVRALTHTDANFRALVELLPASLMVHRAGKILYVNPSWLELLGYERAEELTGRSPVEIVHPDYRQAVRDRISAIRSGGRATPLTEMAMLRKDGGIVPVEVEGVSVVYEGVPAVMVVAKDISKGKKAQEALRLSEENFKSLVQQMPDGMLVSIEGRVVFANLAAARILGFGDPGELAGRTTFELMHPDDRELIARRVRALEAGAPANPVVEERMLGKDGRIVPVEASSIAILFEGKRAVVAAIREISERIKAREDLRQSILLLEKAQQAGHVGTWVGDLRDFTQGSWSKESYAIFGVEEGKFKADPNGFFSLVHPGDRERLRKANEAAIRDGAGFDIEFRIVQPDGAVRWVRSKCEVLRDEQGVPSKLIGSTQDVTDRKEEERTAREKERQVLLNDKLATVGTLAAGVVHEINNPLTFVSAGLREAVEKLDALEERLGPGGARDAAVAGLLEGLRKDLEAMAGGAGRMCEIVRGLKTFVHPGWTEARDVDLNELADSAIDMAYPEIKRKAAVVERDYALEPPVVSANPGKLQQVLVNLLVNAAQAFSGPDGGGNRIGVRTGVSDGKVFVEVEDTGEGIPPETLARIFDPFFTTKPAGVGTGMGLSICRQIVEGYGGNILVRGRLGGGSAFTVLLPARRESESWNRDERG